MTTIKKSPNNKQKAYSNYESIDDIDETTSFNNNHKTTVIEPVSVAKTTSSPSPASSSLSSTSNNRYSTTSEILNFNKSSKPSPELIINKNFDHNQSCYFQPKEEDLKEESSGSFNSNHQQQLNPKDQVQKSQSTFTIHKTSILLSKQCNSDQKEPKGIKPSVTCSNIIEAAESGQQLNYSESLSSFKSIESTGVNSNFSMPVYNPNANMMTNNSQMNHKQSKGLGTSRKSLNKPEINKTEFTASSENGSGSGGGLLALAARKSNNSWLAQSFRKAIGKIDTTIGNRNKKLITNLNKTSFQGQLQPTTTLQQDMASLKKNKKIRSNSKIVLNNEDQDFGDQQDQINANFSDDNDLNDSGDEFEQEQKKRNLKQQHNYYYTSSSLVNKKRSFRSESELAYNNKNGNKQQQNEEEETNSNSNNEEMSRHSAYIKQQKVNTMSPPQSSTNQRQQPPVKLNKVHKSVSSLISTANESSSRLKELNEQFKAKNSNGSCQFTGIQNPPLSLFPVPSLEEMRKCNCNKLNNDMSLVNELKKKLSTAENKLTDIRLEALSSVHQIDQLKDFIDKMKNEMIALKSENQILKQYLKDVKSQKVDLSVSSLQNKSNSNNGQQEILKLEQMFKSNLNCSNHYYSYNFLLGDENECLLRKCLVTIESTYELQPQSSFVSSSSSDLFVHDICTINIDGKLQWHLMDGIVSYAFMRYINTLDPQSHLGLDKSSIERYHIGDTVRLVSDGSDKQPELLPFGYLVGDNCTIRIILKDSEQHLDSLSFSTLMPKCLLEDYVQLVEREQMVAIKSPFGFGKTYLMRKLAQFIAKNSEKHLEIIYFDIDELMNNQFTLKQKKKKKEQEVYDNNEDDDNLAIKLRDTLMLQFNERLEETPKSNSIIILLDNFHLLFSDEIYSKVSVDILNTMIQLRRRLRLYLILSIQESEHPIPIQFNKHLKTINLNGNAKSSSTFLLSYMRRSLIHNQVLNEKHKDYCIIMEKVVTFILELFRRVNEFIATIHGNNNNGDFIENNTLLTPALCMNMPFDNIQNSENWFIKIWNYTVVPFLDELLKTKQHSSNIEQLKRNDPTEWILNYYVWPKQQQQTIGRIQRIKFVETMSNKPFNNSNNRVSSTSDDSTSSSAAPSSSSDLLQQQQENTIMETVDLVTPLTPPTSNQHLLSMLIRLQNQVTSSSSSSSSRNEECSTSGFYESHSNSSANSSVSASPTTQIVTQHGGGLTKTKIESAL